MMVAVAHSGRISIPVHKSVGIYVCECAFAHVCVCKRRKESRNNNTFIKVKEEWGWFPWWTRVRKLINYMQAQAKIRGMIRKAERQIGQNICMVMFEVWSGAWKTHEWAVIVVVRSTITLLQILRAHKASHGWKLVFKYTNIVMICVFPLAPNEQ